MIGRICNLLLPTTDITEDLGGDRSMSAMPQVGGKYTNQLKTELKKQINSFTPIPKKG